MSYCKSFGKDKVCFVTKEDHAIPSTVELPPPEPAQGLITSDGEINWSCPCLGGMATGPCGVEFRDAFSCFHYSKADPKGSDCFEAFRAMQDCFVQYPTVYNKSAGNDDEDEPGLNIANLEDAAPQETSSASPTAVGVEVHQTLAKKED
ncbi:mitochondrial intermembrane space import and assembly protein 40 [Rhagoletis pomonella]|uniref:mitochondrial intermembrane space import and assembly protein 40 n=1 Tax=Rhagoletis pomonella TaxID=28610 RepID=UPI0017849603|nr:mitochondrial intermembrane space import and assembly protein 40 [Rhagoletis pomonella]